MVSIAYEKNLRVPIHHRLLDLWEVGMEMLEVLFRSKLKGFLVEVFKVSE
jgi:hypothetical protein